MGAGWSSCARTSPPSPPDGARILFRAPESEDFLHSSVYTIGVDGTGLTRVLQVPDGTKLYSASFSPDGAAITFGLQGVGGTADVYRMAANGTGATPVTRPPRWDKRSGLGRPSLSA